MKIKQLSINTINRIAAGEVLERPASAVKELLENAIDAKATNIEITINNGGRNLIQIVDNGVGMSKDELAIAILRHTTSKLDEADIEKIEFFGFRGEALPSIAAVSRMTISSIEQNSSDHGWEVEIHGGDIVNIKPSNLTIGTKIEVRDLFYATPARLKFLKSEKTEAQAIEDMVIKLAMAHPNVNFCLKNENKIVLKTNDVGLTNNIHVDRIHEIMGKDFSSNSVIVESMRENVKIWGLASLPTYSKNNASEQIFYVNKRPIRDKLLHSAVKVAYMDFLSHDRYAKIVLFIDIPYTEIDVNVHPTKAEVRFKDSANLRGQIITSVKNALASSGHKTSSTISDQALSSFTSTNFSKNFYTPSSKPNYNYAAQENKQINFQSQMPARDMTFSMPAFRDFSNNTPSQEIQNFPLGAAVCQLHETYIVAQNNKSIVIVDQHAAHERLVYEQLKKAYAGQKVKTQRLLLPEIIELKESIIEKFLSKKEELNAIGLIFEQFGDNAIVINEIPELISNTEVTSLIKDLSEDFEQIDENITLTSLQNEILSSFACHHSIRAGRKLNILEMNELLRQMENTPFSGQCNHGRPTYIELKLTDIERLFGRT